MASIGAILILLLIDFHVILAFRITRCVNDRVVMIRSKAIPPLSTLSMCDAEASSLETEDSNLPPKGTSPKECPFHPSCGCDGTGKMQGGIATYPGFGWWPIKVFRPCPEYIRGGYIYKREGKLWTKSCSVSLATRCRRL